MKLEKIAPKKFLCVFRLKTGALSIGILMFFLMVAITIATMVQTIIMDGRATIVDSTANVNQYPWKIAYGYSITAIIYCIIMTLVHIWFIWGVSKEKSSVIIAWLALSVIWYLHSICIFLVLIILHAVDHSFASWLVSLLFGFIAYALLAYGILVVFGYWIELKNTRGRRMPNGPVEQS